MIVAAAVLVPESPKVGQMTHLSASRYAQIFAALMFCVGRQACLLLQPAVRLRIETEPPSRNRDRGQ